MKVKSLLIILILAIIGTGFVLVWQIPTQYNTVKNLREKIQELKYLEERKKRIKNMEKTLMIHYKLSWYEAHYYSIIFDDIVQENDSLFKAHRLDWYIFPALIRIESNWDPSIVSNKHAKGLMQILENTAKEMVNEINNEKPYINLEYEKSKTVFNDILNLIIGSKYLCKQIADFSNPDDGISAYNGGPGFDKGRKDIGQYRTNVRWEYERLKFIHQGVINTENETKTQKINLVLNEEHLLDTID